MTIAIHNAGEGRLVLNSDFIDKEATLTYLEPDLGLASVDFCPCGEESYYGCHGVRDNKVYSEYLCKKCFKGRLNE